MAHPLEIYFVITVHGKLITLLPARTLFCPLSDSLDTPLIQCFLCVSVCNYLWMPYVCNNSSMPSVCNDICMSSVCYNLKALHNKHKHYKYNNSFLYTISWVPLVNKSINHIFWCFIMNIWPSTVYVLPKQDDCLHNGKGPIWHWNRKQCLIDSRVV